ncbi:LamG-like jellyroll fold domain-containing protein [Rhodovulum sp. P5]|uniref:LamG-like jellyroll fold domain-containing protein n=1 Tax=Rhodovulum sp. P5 TaxID=1564506 RepID=UPI001561512B|nr:LamG-like jellyroll fold domain-containing protein [Rhodovulum sp. P5]
MSNFTKILTAAIFSISAATAQAAVVAEYLFDGNANDTSGNNENLTLAGDAGYASGQFGQALALDGAGDYAYTAFHDYGLSSFTFETWINSRDVNRNVHYISLQMGQYVVLGDYGVADVSTWASGLNPVDVGSITVTQTLSNDTWYHLAFTYDGTTQKVYIDGALAGSAATTGSLSGGYATGLVIGARHTQGTQYVDGLIDNVRIHDVALEQSQLGYYTDGGPANVPLPAGAALLLSGLGAFAVSSLRNRTR